MDLSAIHYSDQTPYPAILVAGKNPRYATAILSNIGSCDSEMSAASLYFYNSLITRSCYADIATCFHHISIVEMRHLDLFGELALKLGTDPRLWSYAKGRMCYWSPSCNQYPSSICTLLQNALAGEQETIRKYQAQADWICDPCIKAILNRIILDEQIHVTIFQTLIRELAQARPAQ